MNIKPNIVHIYTGYSISQEKCTRFLLCCALLWLYTDWFSHIPISIRLTSLALWQSNDCPSASKATLLNMDKYFMWIHYERLHNHNKAKHNKTVCIFLGIYCTLTDFPISKRLTSLALWQSNDCPGASKSTLLNIDKYFIWIHYERLHNHNKTKHNKTVCIFLGIYCTLTDFPISIRLTSLALWQSNDCPSASKATLMNMDKYFMWIHYERLHNHNKTKHNKTVCKFLGIYCISYFYFRRPGIRHVLLNATCDPRVLDSFPLRGMVWINGIVHWWWSVVNSSRLLSMMNISSIEFLFKHPNVWEVHRGIYGPHVKGMGLYFASIP